MADLIAIKRKIRGLLALAGESSGAPKPERETARRLADELMATHGLRERQIPERPVDRGLRRPPPPPQPSPGAIRVVVSFGTGIEEATSNTTDGGYQWTIFE